MRFYTTERLSENQSLTPEGFLLCREVPIARTGEMIYGPSQTTLPTGPDGIVHIRRTVKEVFRPETVASFEGKPFVLDHPDQPDPDRWTVDPLNWAMVAKGHVIGPHRGSGEQAALVMADLLVTDAEAIKEIRRGRREVSCGYIADYVCDDCGSVNDRTTWNQCSCTQPRGYGQQVGILGNHVALVDNGRCGPQCAIGDSAYKEKPMTWVEKVEDALKSKDQVAWEEALAQIPKGKRILITQDGSCRDAGEDDDSTPPESAADQQLPPLPPGRKPARDPGSLPNPPQDTRDAIDAIGRRQDRADAALDRVQRDVKDIKDKLFKFKDQDGDDDDSDSDDTGNGTSEDRQYMDSATSGKRAHDHGNVHDSAALAESFQETVSFAEILSPGFRLPTFDRADPAKRTAATICRTRRAVLDLAYGQADLRGCIDECLRGQPLQGSFTQDRSLTCDSVETIFRTVGMVRKNQNNSFRPASVITGSAGGTGVRGTIKTPAEFNKRMKELQQ